MNRMTTFTHSMIFRFFSILLLLALLAVPTYLLDDTLNKQSIKQEKVVDELSQQWGEDQIIAGPILSIPYVERISRIESRTDSKGVTSSVSKDVFNNKTLVLLPENLKITADLQDKVLSKDGIQAHVYQGEIEFSGNFNLESLPEPSAFNAIEWDKAFLAIGLNNKSVEATSPLRWEGSSSAFKPGTNFPHLLAQGFHANLEDVINDNQSPTFRIQLRAKGNNSLKVAPFAKLTSVSMKSDTFPAVVKGDIDASSKVRSSSGFVASWLTTNLVRNYPQEWLLEEDSPAIKADFNSVLMGVERIEGTKAEEQMQDTLKLIIIYILPILAVIFISLLILEFKRNSRSKPKFIHYIIVSLPVFLVPICLKASDGLADFTQAFQVIAASCIGLISLYIISSLRSFSNGMYILLITASLYGVLYVHLLFPTYILYAFCAAGIFITILLMMVSANIHEDE